MKYFIGSGPHDLTTTALFATIGTAALMVGFPFIGAAYVTDKEAQKKILFGFLCSAPFQYAVQLYSHSNRIHFPPVAALSHFGFMSILYVLSLYTLIQLRKQKKSKGYWEIMDLLLCQVFFLTNVDKQNI